MSVRPRDKTRDKPDAETGLTATQVQMPMAPGGATDERGIYTAPASSGEEAERYNSYGVLGDAYDPRPELPPVHLESTRMNMFAPAESVPVPETNIDLGHVTLSTALLAIERLAYTKSCAVFTYDSSTSSGFGAYCEEQARHEPAQREPGASVYSMQARAGAGNAVAGFLAGEGSALSPARPQAPVSVLTNASGFLAMGPSLTSILDSERVGLVIHVSGMSQATSEDLCVTNDYAATLATATLLGDAGFHVILSASRQEAVDVAHYAYTRKDSTPLVHIFDGAFAASELGRITPPATKRPEPFSYTGPAAPETVLLLPNGSLTARARALLVSLPGSLRSKVGIVSVRSLRPWDGVSLRAVLPASVQTVRVVEEAYSALDGALYGDVLATSLNGELGPAPPMVQNIALAPGQELSSAAWHALLSAAAGSPAPVDLDAVLAAPQPANLLDLVSLSSAHLVTFFGTDSGSTPTAAPLLAKSLFGKNSKLNVRLLQRFDNFAASGALRADLVTSERSSEMPLEVLARDGMSHVVIVSEPKALLQGYRLLDALRSEGTLILNAPGWTAEDVSTSLCAADKRLLAEKRAKVFVVDGAHGAQALVDALAAGKGKSGAPASSELEPPFLLTSVARVVSALQSAQLGDKAFVQEADRRVQRVETHGWADAQAEPEEAERTAKRAAHFAYNSFAPHSGAGEASGEVVRASWALAAWQMLFREAYALDDAALRPDLSEKTYNVEVTVNKRLTPLDYDRNLFHMELSTKGTGLKYEVGEALGVHGWNDDEEVRAFIQWSGYNPDELVCTPSVLHPGRFETRTIFQTLQQNLDIFGKPSKSFFEALGKEVTNKDEARWLRFISSAEGSSTFKKLSESETVTYADVLHMFPSASVSMDWLTKNVEPIKPRHYSIASAQVAVGESVHLLIVTVDWKTPRGSTRFGQCTRYLSKLRPGTKVTVSIKPSVMKLPPFESQPIIMAGLGTGAAPFRAFLQARAHQRAHGKQVGPMYYYFGSRHRSKEYLYGEELEAYLTDGLLTRLGLAFSRDQPQKVYVQHKIVEDGNQLAELLVPELVSGNNGEAKDGERGIFTLCGPVWPVPDIQEALVKALSTYGWTRERSEAKLEQLKEEERYVLEVY